MTSSDQLVAAGLVAAAVAAALLLVAVLAVCGAWHALGALLPGLAVVSVLAVVCLVALTRLPLRDEDTPGTRLADVLGPRPHPRTGARRSWWRRRPRA